uniref:Uncharacterized protein n=1 Tax=Arundo donax TaxID=35708 RepID=A0A0A9CGT0_ARUDO
MWHARCHPRRP